MLVLPAPEDDSDAEYYADADDERALGSLQNLADMRARLAPATGPGSKTGRAAAGGLINAGVTTGSGGPGAGT